MLGDRDRAVEIFGVFKEANFSGRVGELSGDFFNIFDIVHDFIEILLIDLLLHGLALILLLFLVPCLIFVVVVGDLLGD